jgi:hypothetical protein
VLLPRQCLKQARGAKDEQHAMSLQIIPELRSLASISVRTRSTLSVGTTAARLFCGKGGRVTKSRPGLPICHPA